MWHVVCMYVSLLRIKGPLASCLFDLSMFVWFSLKSGCVDTCFHVCSSLCSQLLIFCSFVFMFKFTGYIKDTSCLCYVFLYACALPCLLYFGFMSLCNHAFGVWSGFVLQPFVFTNAYALHVDLSLGCIVFTTVFHAHPHWLVVSCSGVCLCTSSTCVCDHLICTGFGPHALIWSGFFVDLFWSGCSHNWPCLISLGLVELSTCRVCWSSCLMVLLHLKFGLNSISLL